MGNRHRIVSLITDPPFASLFIDNHDQINLVMFFCPFSESQHFWKLIRRIDMNQRERDFSRKSLLGQPDQGI